MPGGHEVNPVHPEVVEGGCAVREPADTLPDRRLAALGRRRPHGAREFFFIRVSIARMPGRLAGRKAGGPVETHSDEG